MEKSFELSEVVEALHHAWDRDTSSDPENWLPENPAWGQCAVTALVVQDYCNGEILWAEAALPDGRKILHYFNSFEDEHDFLRVVDLTREQFPQGTSIPPGVQKTKGFPTTRDYILSYPATQQRYTILKSRTLYYLKGI